eukprot:s1349_g12.t1
MQNLWAGTKMKLAELDRRLFSTFSEVLWQPCNSMPERDSNGGVFRDFNLLLMSNEVSLSVSILSLNDWKCVCCRTYTDQICTPCLDCCSKRSLCQCSVSSSVLAWPSDAEHVLTEAHAKVMDNASVQYEHKLYRPSRMIYPGSRFGPKTRYDLPQRHKAYGNASELEAIIFNGTSLQPQVWSGSSGGAKAPPPGTSASSCPGPSARGQAQDEESQVAASQALRKHTIMASVPTTCQPCNECFKVLKIPPVASLADVTEAYHQQALRWLPEYELEDPEVAEKTFEKLRGAYQVLADAGRSLLTERHLPELPLINDRNDVHGVALLGGKSSGKTTLICSLLAVLNGKYPHSYDYKEKLREMPVYGNSWDFPEREIRYMSGETRQMRVVLTDTPPCGPNPREEHPLCAKTSPNSNLHYSAVPSWMRIILRSGNQPHYAVLFIIDATAPALWEEPQRCRDLARLLAVLKRSQYTVVIGVTKLLKLREDRLREDAYGKDHRGEVGKDPRSSYESFVGRYIDKVCACLQAKAGENDWSFTDGPEHVAFPLPNVSIFDVPTWTSVTDFQAWEGRKGTPELPNFKYYNCQLSRLLHAVCKRSSSEAA